MSQANGIGCNALPPKAAVNPDAIKLKEDIASVDIGSVVNDNNKMLAGKMSQAKTLENIGAPLMATPTVAAAPAASEFNTWRRTKLSSRVLLGGATGAAGRTNLAVRPLAKNQNTAPLRAA